MDIDTRRNVGTDANITNLDMNTPAYKAVLNKMNRVGKSLPPSFHA